MGLDTPVKAAIPDTGDKAVHIDENGKGDHVLHRLQEGAGLHDKIGIPKIMEGVGDLKDPHIGGDGTYKLEPKAPSDKERADAEKTLEGRMSKLIPEADREAMKAMTTAITNGDANAFAEAVKKAGGNPEKLKKLVEEVDKMLEEKGSHTRLDVTSDGKVLVSDGDRGKALSFDPKTGNVEARSVQQNHDGSIRVLPGELLHVDKDKSFKDMGDRAVDAVNGKIDFSVFKTDPFHPIQPFENEKPWFRKDDGAVHKLGGTDPNLKLEKLGRAAYGAGQLMVPKADGKQHD